jgi:hypothetical protein
MGIMPDLSWYTLDGYTSRGGDFKQSLPEHQQAIKDLNAQLAAALARAGLPWDARGFDQIEPFVATQLALHGAPPKDPRAMPVEEILAWFNGGPKPRTATGQQVKRKRSTKQQTELKTLAAIAYKMAHPDATDEQCANHVGIPRTTLTDRDEWQEWSPKIAGAFATGKLPTIKAQWDQRIGQLVAVDMHDDANA